MGSCFWPIGLRKSVQGQPTEAQIRTHAGRHVQLHFVEGKDPKMRPPGPKGLKNVALQLAPPCLSLLPCTGGRAHPQAQGGVQQSAGRERVMGVAVCVVCDHVTIINRYSLSGLTNRHAPDCYHGSSPVLLKHEGHMRDPFRRTPWMQSHKILDPPFRPSSCAPPLTQQPSASLACASHTPSSRILYTPRITLHSDSLRTPPAAAAAACGGAAG